MEIAIMFESERLSSS